MPPCTIKQSTFLREDDWNGPLNVYELDLDNPDGSVFVQGGELSQRPQTEVPMAGGTIDAFIAGTTPQGKPRLKRTPQQQGQGQPVPAQPRQGGQTTQRHSFKEDPQKARRITRQWAIGQAVQFISAAGGPRFQGQPLDIEDRPNVEAYIANYLLPIANAFELDVTAMEAGISGGPAQPQQAQQPAPAPQQAPQQQPAHAPQPAPQAEPAPQAAPQPAPTQQQAA